MFLPHPAAYPEGDCKEQALALQADAEAGIFETWNKSGDATDQKRDAILTKPRARLSTENDSIVETMEGAGRAAPDAPVNGDTGVTQ